MNLSQAFSILLPIPQLDLPPINFPSLSHGGVNELTEGLIQEKPTLTPSAIHSIALPPEIRTKINAHSHKLMPHVLGPKSPLNSHVYCQVRIILGSLRKQRRIEEETDEEKRKVVMKSGCLSRGDLATWLSFGGRKWIQRSMRDMVIYRVFANGTGGCYILANETDSLRSL